MCFLQLRQALFSIVCVIVLFSGCATPYATIGESSETQLAPDSYRGLFSPTGYISWDLAYREALLRCADLTLKMATPILVLWRSITTAQRRTLTLLKTARVTAFITPTRLTIHRRALASVTGLCPL